MCTALVKTSASKDYKLLSASMKRGVEGPVCASHGPADILQSDCLVEN